MLKSALNSILIQILIIFAILLILYIVFKNLKSYDYEKKFSEFSLLSNKDTDISFFDRLHVYFWELVHKLSNILKYSKVIENHSKKYENDIKLDSKNIKSSMDYISIKIIVGCILVGLMCITALLQYIKFDFMKVLILFIVGYLLPNIVIMYRRKKKKKRLKKIY